MNGLVGEERLESSINALDCFHGPIHTQEDIPATIILLAMTRELLQKTTKSDSSPIDKHTLWEGR